MYVCITINIAFKMNFVFPFDDNNFQFKAIERKILRQAFKKFNSLKVQWTF